MTRLASVAAGCVAFASVTLVSGCGGDADTLDVVAAASLTDAFDDLAAAFEASPAGRDVDIRLAVAGSSRLATQIEEGAPTNIVATADRATMDRIEASGRLHGPITEFATNSLVVVSHPDAPVIGSLDELGGDVLVAVCAPQVPCGSLTARLFASAGVDVNPATREPNVRSVLTKVQLGEVDAGVVYLTDALAAGDAVRVFVPPGAATLVNAYPIAEVDEHPAGRAFIDYVVGPGQTILAEHGFGEPPP